MRPVKLRIQGLTSYRSPVEIDFSDLDLFAITGPTGAGKSSIVDAITFALFGQAPRVGGSVKQLISLNEESLKVELEFQANGERYRVHRGTARTRQSPVQVERFDPQTGEWMPEEDRSEKATDYITRALGMEYETFVRSVLLPQGQFQQFLAGKPEERRKVLDGLLRLDVYQRMQERANSIAGEHLREADRIAELLRTEYADATPENLKTSRGRLKELRDISGGLTAVREALAGACTIAERLKAGRERRQRAAAQLQRAEAELEQARKSAETAGKEMEGLQSRLSGLEKVIAENRYDAELHNRLTKALVLVEQLERAEAKVASLGRETVEKEQAREREQAAAGQAEERERAAAAEHERRRSQMEEVRRQDMAAGLRQGLKPGDPCPVCERPIKAVAAAEHPLLEEAERALAEARAAHESAREAAHKALTAAKLAAQAAESSREHAGKAEKERESCLRAFEQAMPGQAPERAALQTAERDQQAARKERLRLEEEARTARKRQEQLREALDEARLAALAAKLEAARRELDTAGSEVSKSAERLRLQAKERGWQDALDALSANGDALPPLKSRLAAAQQEIESLNRDIGACETNIGRLEQAIERVGELREREKSERSEGRLAKDLAMFLRADRFQAFVREQALHTLAEDGSLRLEELSRGRYTFSVEGQDFLIVDGWSAGEARSVKTLSGGETFLASLALALALAERLPELSAGAEAAALESLFIDEGFSHLDEETLDLAASALEVLGAGRDRLIGVITHLPALAERMPARIVVHKAESGSAISVE